MKWQIFSAIFLLQIAVTYKNYITTCQNTDWLLYFFHHILDVFLFWSILFLETSFEYKLHIVLSILVMIHWFTYDNKCIATVIMNRKCGYPEELWLDSLKNKTGLTGYFHFWWIIALVLFDIKRITLNNQ